MFASEIAARMAAQGVGILGQTLFIGSKANIPVGIGPYVWIIETGGTSPARTHNNTATQRPTAQITVRAKDYYAARLKAVAAYDALGGANGLWNIRLSSVFYLSLTTRQEPTDIGLDDNERQQFVFNIDGEKQPS
jgi:hypothetical protein